jgi:transposase
MIHWEKQKPHDGFFLEEHSVLEGNLFLSLSDHLQVDRLTATATDLLVQVVSTQTVCCCPLCGQPSDHIHSYYRRMVADVPCGNRPVTLYLHVRKFFCRTESCPRKIFTERLPDLVQPSARLTNRLRAALEELGLMTGGEGGSRLAAKLGMQVRPTTLLRRVRAVSSPEVSTVRVLGLDDWAYKRGQHYGTILVDLEHHRVIDLLADRTKETAQAWLQRHPEIEVISRDRAGNYADAARQGAPQALQVADRFHLLKNVRESLKDLLDRKRGCLPLREKEVIACTASSLQPSSQQEAASRVNDTVKRSELAKVPASDLTKGEHLSGTLTADERRRKFNREKRYALYEEVWSLRRQGLSHYAIADVLGISRPTVRRFLAAEQFPERLTAPRAKHTSIVAPYLSFLAERWQAGCHNGHQLFREAKARGYPGSQAQLGRLITEWRKQLPPPSPRSLPEPCPTPAPRPKQQRLSSQQASWLFVLAEEQLTAQQRRQKEHLVRASEELAKAYRLSQDFVAMLKERKAEELQEWLQRVGHSQITEFKSLAKSMQRDYAAIYAACSQPWSQGQVEGQVNRLKCLKRQMYGRANFDLLRIRVLHAA